MLPRTRPTATNAHAFAHWIARIAKQWRVRNAPATSQDADANAPWAVNANFDIADRIRHQEWETWRLERRAAETTASRVPLGAAKPQYKQQQHEEHSNNDMPGRANNADQDDVGNITSSHNVPQTKPPKTRLRKPNKQGSKRERLSFLAMTAIANNNDYQDGIHDIDASCCTYDVATQDDLNG